MQQITLAEVVMTRCIKLGTAPIETAALLWHHRLGHANMSMINVVMKRRRYGTLPSDNTKTQDCLSCTKSELTKGSCKRRLFTKIKTITNHEEICNSMTTTPRGGNKYFLVMTTGGQKFV